MHELSIALSIVEIASEEAARQPGSRVEAVHLRLGPLSGVVKDALLFSWKLACEETPVAGSQLAIEEVGVRVRCPACGVESDVTGDLDLRCGSCGNAATEVIRGRELEVTALELEDR
jgi:hydrogenase nickel incorporation protein HypA/HybF